MEFISGDRLSDCLDNLENWKDVCFKIGESIAKLHDSDVIHGDLTTSNMILTGRGIYFIDFGLGFVSSRVEDKAVDLHLIKQALEAKHYSKFEEFFKEILHGYSGSKDFERVVGQLRKVESRGRYKGQY